MKPTVKLFLKPKYKIGSSAWTLNYGVSMMDYFHNPTDDKLRENKVVGYSISYFNGKAKITAYHFEKGGSETGNHNWDFVSKKEIKEYLKQKAIENYRFRDPYKLTNMEKFNLNAEERKLLKL